MLKKICIAIAASAFALTLAAPVVSACPGKDQKITKKENDV